MWSCKVFDWNSYRPVHAIEKAGLCTTLGDRKTVTFRPAKYSERFDFWEEEDWNVLMEDPRAIYYALLDGETIVGNVLIYNWQGERDYIKIMNIAIHADYRNHSLAHKLLNYVTTEMKQIGMHRFCGETRASNLAMQRVFENCGYKLSVIEEDYYDNPKESAYKYVLQI